MTADILEHLALAYGQEDLRLVERVSPRVLHVITRTGELAVKVFESSTLAAARCEAALLAHLAHPDPRYRVQKLVFTTGAEPLCSGDFGAALVTRWVPGRTKLYTEIDVDEWRALGRSLGALHTRLERFGDTPRRWSERLVERDPARARRELDEFAAVAVSKDPARAAAMRCYLDEQRALFDRHIDGATRPPPVAEQAIHNDYNQHNYLFDGREPPVILDWDRAISAPREYEVVRCLNHLPLVAPQHASAFVDGYLGVLSLRSEALRWALDAALVEHAIKQWPLLEWLDDRPHGEAVLDGNMAMVHALAEGTSHLQRFYAAVSSR